MKAAAYKFSKESAVATGILPVIYVNKREKSIKMSYGDKYLAGYRHE